MADVITRFKLETSQYDSKLRDSAKSLSAFSKQAELAGKDFDKFSKGGIEAARAIGQVESGANNTKDKLKDLVGAYNDVAKAYNKLTEEQRQSDFAKAMAASLTQFQQRIKETKQELYSLGDAAKDGGGLFGGKLDGMLQVFGGNVMTKIAGMGVGFAAELKDMVMQGAELARQGEGIRIAFERLGRGDILDGLRQATHGTVTDIELMKAAVQFNDFKLPLDELGTMLAFAQQKAKDTGQSVDYLVNSIVTGLGRKSKMILDNLGLSASEIDEKMKKTGDMTKAVGEIIREQMAKAGDYIETAADRAAQADTDLKNAMEDLGRTFQPLTDAGTSMWNSLKIGALDLLNSAVKPLIQALSEAGTLGQSARANAGFNNLGGNSKVDRMIGRLGNGKTQGAYSIYQQQLDEFDKYINNKRFQIASYSGDNSGIAKSNLQRLQSELDGALRMRAEYVKRAQELHNQVPSVSSDASDDKSKKKSGKTSSTKAEQTELQLNQKKINDLTNEYVKLGDNATEAAKKRQEEIQKEIQLLIQRNNLLNIRAENAQGKLQGGEVGTEGLVKVDSLLYNDIVPSIDQIRNYLEKNPIKIPIEAASDKIKGIMKTASITADVVGSIGDAFNAIEDPAAKVAGTIAQAIASVALGYATATSQAGSMGPWAWVAFAATGLAEMLTMISTIHSATGYASGGIVGGNSFSGDNVPAMVGNTVVGLNAGELILNKSQQNNIASQLTQAGGGGRLVAKLRGRDILISLERELSETGKGQLATWR